MNDHDELWDALSKSSAARTTPIQERLGAIIEATKLPEKFWDANLRQLIDMGAIPILRKMITERPSKIENDHEFLQAFSRCPTIE